MKILDVTSLQASGQNPNTAPALRTVEVHNVPEGGRYCLHVHDMAQFTVMCVQDSGQVELLMFGAGATFFNDETILDALLSNPCVTQALDLGQISLTDGQGYRILPHNTGQYVIDTKLQVNENTIIPVAQFGKIRGLDAGSKYLLSENTSALSKRHGISAGPQGHQSLPTN